LPLELEEVKNLPQARPKAGLVDWETVIDNILKTGKYFSAKEVTETFVDNKVKVFRTKAVLDRAVEDGILAKYWHERRYVYGKPIKK